MSEIKDLTYLIKYRHNLHKASDPLKGYNLHLSYGNLASKGSVNFNNIPLLKLARLKSSVFKIIIKT